MSHSVGKLAQALGINYKGITVTVHLTWLKPLGQKAFNKRHHASFEQ